MKLKDYNQKNSTKRLIGLYESQFGEKIAIPKNKRSLRQLAVKINENINQFKHSSRFHSSQQEPAYLKMLAVREIVENAIREYTTSGTTATTGTTTATGTTTNTPINFRIPINNPEMQRRVQKVKDPRTKQMLQKAAGGENMDQDEVKRLADVVLKGMVTENNKDDYCVVHEKEDDLWVVKDSLGNWIEPFVEKIDAMRALRKYKSGSPQSQKTVHQQRYSLDVDESSCKTKPMKRKTNEIAPLAAVGMAARAVGGAVSGAMQSNTQESVVDSDTKKVEAHGVRGVKSRPWRKVFKNAKHFEKWLEKYQDELEVYGVRELNESVINESEIQSAQVVLAAQDLVDQVQKMIENASESQFKDLPALAAQIKIDQDSEKSNRFYQIANEAFGEIIGNLQQAKSKLEEAMGVLTGETTSDFDFDQDKEPVTKKPKVPELPSDDDVDLDLEKETGDITGLGRERR